MMPMKPTKIHETLFEETVFRTYDKHISHNPDDVDVMMSVGELKWVLTVLCEATCRNLRNVRDKYRRGQSLDESPRLEHAGPFDEDYWKDEDDHWGAG